MLGEVALVPKESPINQSGLMFFNTLFDENACCHVAAGRGFSEVIEGFMDMTDEEIYAKGINDSIIHMDSLIGSDDLHMWESARMEARRISSLTELGRSKLL